MPRDGGRRQAESLNLAGSAIFTAAVMAFVVGATLITQAGGRVAGGLLLAACVALAGGFVLVDRRAAAPLLPPELIRSRRLRQGALASLLNTATTSSAMTLVTLYLQDSLRRTPLQAAASLLPFSLAVIGGSALAAAVQRRAGPSRLVAQRLIAAGLALIAVSDTVLIPLAALAWAVPLSAAVGGAGIGLSSVAATGLGTDVAPRWRGGASGIINTAAQLGTAVGIARCSWWPRPPAGSPRRARPRPGPPGPSPHWSRRRARPGSPSPAGAGPAGEDWRARRGRGTRPERCTLRGRPALRFRSARHSCPGPSLRQDVSLWTVRSRCGRWWRTIWRSWRA